MDRRSLDKLALLNRDMSFTQALTSFSRRFSAVVKERGTEHEQNRQAVTLGAPGSGKSRFLTELALLLHHLTPERAERVKQYLPQKCEPEFLGSLLGAECLLVTYNHNTQYAGPGLEKVDAEDKMVPLGLAVRMLLQYYFKITDSTDVYCVLSFLGSAVLSLTPADVASSILADLRESGRTRTLILLVDEVGRLWTLFF
eukprot:m51a1_g4961 hypothetical protein (199) ;mRNA; r:363192-363962